MKHGSLCSGYEGIGLGLAQVFPDIELAWVSDVDPGACKVLAHRFPDVPNIGDMTAVDWSQVEPVDVLSGGTPCQDLSHAGRRRGMSEGTRSNLWVAMREAIAVLKPSLVIWENVRGAYSADADSEVEPCPGCVGDGSGRHLRALGRVLGDLADVRYDARWYGLRAADVGAPHGRFRVFVAAYPADLGHEWGGITRGRGTGPADGGSEPVALLPTPSVADVEGGRKHRSGARSDELLLNGIAHHEQWGKYAEAVTRWESLTRPAPAPTAPGRNGNPRLSAEFPEWMMGLPAGWITDVPGITRNEALRLCGNGVVSQQCAAALRLLLSMEVAA